jgi:hypothetical protein
MLRILNLGAGTQSFCLFAMSAKGFLPHIDHASFADPKWEDRRTYALLRECIADLALDSKIELHWVSGGDLRADVLTSQVRGTKEAGKRWASMPLYTRDPKTGKVGQIKRQCTKEYKAEPLRIEGRRILGLTRGSRTGFDLCEQWRGISLDEIGRAKPPNERYIQLAYPLVNMTYHHTGEFRLVPVKTKRGQKPKFKKEWTCRTVDFDGQSYMMTRGDCRSWLQLHGFPIPARSACLGCPYHSDEEWLSIKSDPESWADVVEFDRCIRKLGGMRGDCYLHDSCLPLDEIDFEVLAAAERARAAAAQARRDAQPGLFANKFVSECEGLCGL